PNGMVKEANTLLAYTNQYKHPILQAWAKFLVGMIVCKEDYIEEAKTTFSSLNIRVKNLIENEKFRFFLFNNFTVKKKSSHTPQLQNWTRKKAEELLIFLLTQPQYQVEKEVVLEELY